MGLYHIITYPMLYLQDWGKYYIFLDILYMYMSYTVRGESIETNCNANSKELPTYMYMSHTVSGESIWTNCNAIIKEGTL